MTIHEMIQQRQSANRQILQLVMNDPFIKEHFEDVKYYIEHTPQQRFAQIICNYICPTYRDATPNPDEHACMARLFPNNRDPFYEESIETLERLQG